jgi:O-antigen/teichoic acid export membrane protein
MKETILKIVGISSANLLSQILQLLIFVLAARQLGPAELGIFAIVLVLINFAVGLFDFGHTTYFTRELAFGRMPIPHFWNEVRDRSLFLISIAAIASIVLLSTGHIVWATACWLLVTQYVFQTLQASFKSRVKLKRLASAIVLDRLLCLLALVGMSFASQITISNVIIAWSLGQSSAIFILAIGRDSTRFVFSSSRIIASLSNKKTLHLGVQSISSIIPTTDQLILGTLGGPAQAGILAAVAKWFTSFAILGNSFSTVALNQAANLKKSYSQYLKSETKPFLLMITLCSAVILASYVYGDELIEFTLGPEFQLSAPLLPLLAASATMALIGQIATSSLQYFGFEKAASKANIIGGVTYLAVLFGTLSLIGENEALVLAVCQFVFQSLLTCTLILVGFIAKSRE